MKWHKKILNNIPGLKKKPDKSQPKPRPLATTQPQAVEAAKPAEPPAPEIPPTKAQKMLDDVCAFLARYLQCSDHQRTVLALWVLHTHCFSVARATPYLAIQSSQKLSGKTLCLRLLSVLCAHPALTSGYTAAAMVSRISSDPNACPTFLLDCSSATLGSRSRSKNPKLQAILASGFLSGIGYTDRKAERAIFSPKAFAALGTLSESLADCSIPIFLKPLKTRVAHPPGSPARAGVARDGVETPSAVSSVLSAATGEIERFDLDHAREEAKSLVSGLQTWSSKNLSSLKASPVYKRNQFPAGLDSRSQDMVEPLLHLADSLGGQWPDRARKALTAVFHDVDQEELAMRIQLLRDIRQIFQNYSWPDNLPTAVLLDDLRALPSRPWEMDGPMTKHRLASMLQPFKIGPRMLRSKLSQGKSSGARGYLQEQFVTLWNDLLKADSPKPSPQPQPEPEKTQQSGPVETRVAQQPPSQQAVVAQSTPATQSITRTATVAPATSSPIPNKDAACCNVAEPRIDPRIKGILDDPRNFYRQYPDQYKNELRRLLSCPTYQWPQPADDKMPPDAIYTIPGGINVPFTIMNRPPRKPPLTFPDFRTERWPVINLSENEQLQVALARLYEHLDAAQAERAKENAEMEKAVVAS
jgi:hypothetical protein